MQCVYETKIHDIDDLQKRLMQTWFGFEQAVSDTAIDQWRDWDHVCVLVADNVHMHFLCFDFHKVV